MLHEKSAYRYIEEEYRREGDRVRARERVMKMEITRRTELNSE